MTSSHASARRIARLAGVLGVLAAACGTPSAAAPASEGARQRAEQRAEAAQSAIAGSELGERIDLDSDPVRLRALGVGNTPEQARARAFENVRVEAARIRSVRVSSETTLAESTQSLHSSDGFDAAVSSSSLSAHSRQRTAAVLRGVAPTLVELRALPTGAHEALAEISVPREQIVPQRVLAELARRGAALGEFEGFRLRALQREDWEAVAQVETQLLAVDASEQRVLDLALTHERRGRLPLALQVIDSALESGGAQSPKLRARRETLAAKLIPAEREIDELLRGLRGPRGHTTDHGLALSADRRELAFRRTFVIRGRVPEGHDLLLFWVDAEQLTAWSRYVSGEWHAQEYAIESAAEWRAGSVHCVALSGPELGAAWDPELDVDLGACARGDLSERERLASALAFLRELASAPGVATQVLSWTHLERKP